MIAAGADGYTPQLLQSLFNVLTDRLLFDTLSFYDDMPAFKAFILGVVREEETPGLQADFQAVLDKKALVDSVRIVRPDFLRVLVFFVLKTQPALAKYSLALREGSLFRVLRQLETVYSAMKLDALEALMDALELDRFDTERRVMEASACGQLRVRVDKVARVVLFEENKTECDVLSSYLNALGAA